jgi:hypothetical protein
MFYGNNTLSVATECNIVRSWNKSETYANSTMAISGSWDGFSMEQCLPTSSDKNISVALDSNYTFGLSDFSFSDPMGATLAYIYITTTPSYGNLTLGGSSVTSNQKIDINDIATLVYTPNTSYAINDYFSFIVNNSDDLNSSSEYNVSQLVDTTPDAFSFGAKTNQEFNTLVTSSAVTIQGIDDATPISISGGEYMLNSDGNWTSSARTINNAQSVSIRVTSANSYSTKVSATLTVGTVSQTFDVTTKAAPPSNAKPTLKGLSETINMDDTQTINPFSSAEVDDRNNDELSIKLSLDSNTTGTLSSYEIESSDIASAQKALRAITFTPIENIAPVGDNNITTITIEVSDGKDTTTATVDINATSINNAPEIKTALSDEQITLDSTQTFNLSIGDRDLDDLNFTATSNNIVAITPKFTNPIVDADYSVNSFPIEIQAIAEGNATVTLTLTDGNLSTTQSFSIEVPLKAVENNETDTSEEENSTNDNTDPTTENNNTSSNTTGSSETNTTNPTNEDNNTTPPQEPTLDNEETNSSTPTNEEEPQESNTTQEPLTFIQVVETVAKFNEKLDVEVREDDTKQVADIVTPEGQTIHIELDKSSNVAKVIISNPITGKTKTFTINLKGSQTYVDEKGGVVITVKLDNGGTITNTIETDGTIEHKITYNGKTTKATIAIEDANTTVNEDGSLITQAKTIVDGLIYRAIIITDSEGNFKTKFIKIDETTGEEILSHTLRSDMNFDLGSTMNIFKQNGKIFIKTKTKLTTDLIIE